MEVSAQDKADAEGSQYGGINASANDVHLPAIGMRCLDIVNANRDEREARGIDQNVENGSHSSVLRPEAQKHLHEKLYGQSYHGSDNQPSWHFISPVHPLHVQSGNTQDEDIDKHK